MHVWLEVFGWIGSVLVVVSLMQGRVLRFRWMNLAGAVAATIYNAIIEIWPFAAMNAAIAIIDIIWLARLYRESDDPETYRVLSVAPADAYLHHFLSVHGDDIAASEPGFAAPPITADAGRTFFLVVRGDEAVGVVVVRDAGDGVGVVELDWVTQRFRDFTPGLFVYRDSGALPAAGFTSAVVHPHGGTDFEYLRRAGFRSEQAAWVRDLVA